MFAVSLLLVVTIGSAVQLQSMPLGLTFTELVLILLPAVLFVRRSGSWRAVGITSLLFALFHVNPWVFLPALFLGVVFGCLVVRPGSVVPAMLSHVACNATAFTVSYLFRDQQDASVYPLLAVLSVTFCAAGPVF